jgi:hypothetical protein
MPDTKTYSVPMELHIVAESREDALTVAQFVPAFIADNDTGTTHTLLVATDDPDDIDIADE